MDAAWEWFKSNWPWLVPVIIYILTNIVNGLSNHPKVASWLHTVIDVLSFLAKKNAPDQTLKMPFSRSAKPGAMVQPPMASGNGPKAVAILLPFLLLGGAALLPGCPGCDKVKTDVVQVSKQCALPAVQKLVNQILPQVVAALISMDFSNLLNQLVATLEQQGIQDALGVVSCAVATVDFNMTTAMTQAKNASATQYAETLGLIKQHAQSWLAGHSASHDGGAP